MKKNKAIFLAILLIGAILVGGWYVFINKKDSDPDSKQAVSQTKSTANKDEPYLVIKEYGIRFTIPESLRGDISYRINDQANRDFGGPTKVELISSSFNASSFKCDEVGTSPKPLLALFEESGSDGNTQDPAPFKQIGNKRYYFVMTSCEETIGLHGSDTDKQKLRELKDAVSSTLERI